MSGYARFGVSADDAWVPMPSKSSPEDCCSLRYAQIAWLVARMCRISKPAECATAMPGGVERNALFRHERVRYQVVIDRDETRHVYEHRCVQRLALYP